MILRFGRVHVKPGTWDAFEAAYHEMLTGAKPGGVYVRWLARELGTQDRGFTVGLWESEEAVADWLGSNAHAAAAAKLTPFSVGGFEVHVSELRLDETALRDR